MKTLPIPDQDLMITYTKTEGFGAYGDQKRKITVTKRGFYSKLFNNYTIPPEYRYFNGVLLPHGFGSDHPSIAEVIDWKYCEDQNKQ